MPNRQRRRTGDRDGEKYAKPEQIFESHRLRHEHREPESDRQKRDHHCRELKDERHDEVRPTRLRDRRVPQRQGQ
jgi:hypothetical protein